ncbi:phenylalanine-4-hydroxylase [Legionella quinlivanii]|uniref:Phenylalanine-4-hydroxylase n=1 Tax=Legionella quinlivanii TaxID=45073 RepID=A0A0W0Y305_9GAMM|nr:phenylalanine 4-monooxygenase [Legionella quinlivanii]KTD51425.1 phenylalanine-4-hydroxylase [Legionella quinlivanii]MCW8451593.1 phenylalanine 4-monooxygenase [Legionella quinlivanii]SEG11113.1 Phenylalanine 4-hydroxylase [Legionella quinlivanii DSM 21216]STY10185.1 phenylalanine-4-hydroxylase [Legionella quinlivanii]
MEFVSRYVSHKPDSEGMVNYSPEEHRIWQLLYERQMPILVNRACDEFLNGLERLGLSADGIPQLPHISRKLLELTGWQVEPVAALISAREFFELLAQRKFPAATFIRCEEELNYVQEPDIFHELFGHCPMLTNPVYADFVCNYAQRVLGFSEDEWPLLQRLFWFTVEFGLINNRQGLRAYGGGILSSISETAYSVESEIPMRAMFNPITAFRTPYRIDQLQKVYFVIDSYEQLYELVTQDISKLINRARELGEYPPFFSVDPNNPSIHILAC